MERSMFGYRAKTIRCAEDSVEENAQLPMNIIKSGKADTNALRVYMQQSVYKEIAYMPPQKSQRSLAASSLEEQLKRRAAPRAGIRLY